ncbi:tyrosine-type recombinase/integrase [Dechloromonas sp. ZS-1]|uniref:tyrosine-type recombinase/integrase n=1 Tax=Dechloromonas sp. ZS-1 TaxID=3138067 RepID=UPI0031FDA34D
MTSSKQLSDSDVLRVDSVSRPSASVIDLASYRQGESGRGVSGNANTVSAMSRRQRAKQPASLRIENAFQYLSELPSTVAVQLRDYQRSWERFESGLGARPQPQVQISIPGAPDLAIQAYYTGTLKWRVRHPDPLTGNWTCSILDSLPEMSFAGAAAAQAKLLDDVAMGVLPGIGNRMTLDQAVIEHVFPNSERNGKKSLRNDRYRYPKHVKRLWGAMLLSALTEPVIRRGVEEIRSLETPASAEKHVALIKFICRDLEALRLIAYNPAARIKMRRVENPVLVIPSDEQLAKLGRVLMSGPPTINSDFFLVQALTGTRSRELQYALVSDLDVNRKVLIVRETKSGRIEEVHLCDAALTVLIRRKSLATGRYLFGSKRGDRPIGYPRHAFLKLCGQAGVTGITSHAFRRGFATAVVQAPGGTSHDASKLLRHSNVRTTEKFYLVATDSRLQQAANAAGQAIAHRLGLDPKGRPYLRPSVRSLVVPDHIRLVAA